MSLRHRMPEEESRLSAEDRIVLREDQQQMIDALQTLPRRQRDCVTLRYYLELSIPDIAMTLGISVNSVKTHLQRGMATLEARLEATT
jgi:RNA polymerase sigma-70 factor (ECF subfamily)